MTGSARDSSSPSATPWPDRHGALFGAATIMIGGAALHALASVTVALIPSVRNVGIPQANRR